MAQLPQDFSDYLDTLNRNWPKLDLQPLIDQDGPESVAIVVVDLVKGFTETGPLASPRVGNLVKPAADFLSHCHQLGIDQVFLGCDAHPSDSPEFANFPPHCIQGTVEAELDAGLTELPFSASFQNIPKNSLSSFVGTDLEARLRALPSLKHLIFIGDCTDLCIYHGAMTAKMLANAHKLAWTVYVHADIVDTYDLPTNVALEIGATPHPGDFIHQFFLYHLHLNGVKVVS
jgi:nicotinamidase-related amidase